MCKYLSAGKTSQQMQQLHKNIGASLIEVKKVNPALEQTIYTLLDEVGTMHKLSASIIQKRKKIKSAFEEEKNMRTKLAEENETLKAKLKTVETNLTQENSKSSYYQQQCDELAKEKTELIGRKAELEAKERDYQNRIKSLEKTTQKTSSLDTHSALPKKEQTRTMAQVKEKNNELLASPQKVAL